MKYGQMIMAVETVTPSIARRWLTNNNRNRRMRPHVADQYARDMLAGNWHRKPVAICFDEDGMLGNGQHTLTGIMQSNTAQELLIARNVPRKAIAFMDMGLKRTMADIANFVGEQLENRKASIARVIRWGPRDTSPKTFDELLDAYRAHDKVIDWVVDHAPAHGASGSMLAVCAKAAYTCDRMKIQRFLDIIKTGIVDGDHESAAVRLRDFTRSLRGAYSQAVREEVYNKTMNALSTFLDGRPVSRIYGTATDLFPIPSPNASGRP